MEVGGGGRYIVLHIKSQRVLVTYDVCEAKVIGHIPVDDENVHFAAGAEKLVVALEGKKVLSRWDLATQKREALVNVKEPIQGLVMGSDSDGPLLIYYGNPDGSDEPNPKGVVRFQRLDNFQLIKAIGADGEFVTHSPKGARYARASANGHTFTTIGHPGYFYYDGKSFEAKDLHLETFGEILLPSPDGEVVYWRERQLDKYYQKELGKTPRNTPSFPARHGNYYLTIIGNTDEFQRPKDDSVRHQLMFFVAGNPLPFAELDGFDLFGGKDYRDKPTIHQDKRIVFVPDAKIIVTLAPTRDALHLRKFDPDAALQASGLWHVTSKPPTTIKPKSALKYQLVVKPNPDDAKFALSEAPEGMEISKTGLLTWQAPAASDKPIYVKVDITGRSGQEVAHTFTLKVAETAGGDDGPAAKPMKTPMTTRPKPTERPAPAAKEEPRTWTEAGTGRTLEAALVSKDKTKVRLRTKAGKIVDIPLERLSREDLQWLLEK
jgi:hypothetical protein